MGESFGLIIGSSGDDFWVFSTAWVSNWRHGFVDRWLGWWVWWPLLAPTSLMVCVCAYSSVDGLYLCVCGFVVVGLWLKWLVILGFRWVSDGFFFFFFPSIVTLGFFFLIWVFVLVGFW